MKNEITRIDTDMSADELDKYVSEFGFDVKDLYDIIKEGENEIS